MEQKETHRHGDQSGGCQWGGGWGRGGVEERRVVGGLERQDGEPCSGYVLLQGEWMRGGVSPPQAPLGFLRNNDISRYVLRTCLDPVDWSHAKNRELENTGHSS